MSAKNAYVQQGIYSWIPPDWPKDGALTQEWYSQLKDSLNNILLQIQKQQYANVNNVTKPLQSSIGTIAVPQVLWVAATSGGAVTQQVKVSNGVVVALAAAYTPPANAVNTPLQIPIPASAPSGKVSKTPS